MDDVRLVVNGAAYGGWKSVRITRGIEALAGSFELLLGPTDKWSPESWPIREEDECRLLVDGETLITGWVDKRKVQISPRDRSISVSGRDKAGALVDCSAVLTDWEYYDASVVTLAKKLAAPFGLEVRSELAPAPARITKLSIDRGDTAWEALERACRMAGVLAVSDGSGRVLLTRPGSARAEVSLVEGSNLLGLSADYDATGRFRTYRVTAQQAGGEDLEGEQAANVQGSASDMGVSRAHRVLLVRADTAATVAYAASRARWEATVRAARGEAVTARVQGWRQTAAGALWPVNALVRVRSAALGLDGDMLITEATYSLSDTGGTVTELALKRPDAYRPAPVLATGQQWAELRRGVR